MKDRISRRSMIKTTAALGTGYWLSSSLAPARAAAASDKLNVAFIGIGGRGGANLGGVAGTGQNVVALCDVDDKTAGKAYGRHPKAKKYYDFRKMLDEMDKQIDAVVVSTPDHTHFHPSVMALQMGKHLYCEKPMAHTVWEVRVMSQLAKKMNVATQLGVQRHTIGNVHRVVELVQSGAIGAVSEVHSWVGGDRGMPGLPKEKPAVPDHLKWDLWLGPAADRPYRPDYCPYKWRFWWDFGTGETGNWGCHILDIPYWALGLTYPTRVEASGPTPDEKRTPKSLSSRLDFPAVGNRPAVALHWHHTKNGPPVLQEHNLSGKGANTVFIGSKGILVCGFGDHRLYPQDKFADFKRPAKTIPDSPGFYREWITACKGGAPATCNFDYSGPLTETVLLANAAYRAGQPFEWDAGSLTATGSKNVQQYLRPTFRKGWEVDVDV